MTPELQAAVELWKRQLGDEYEAGEPRSQYDVAIVRIINALEAAQKELGELRKDKELVDFVCSVNGSTFIHDSVFVKKKVTRKWLTEGFEKHKAAIQKAT